MIPVSDDETWFALERPWGELDVTRAYRQLAKLTHPDTGIYGQHGASVFDSATKARKRLLDLLASLPGKVMPKAPQARSTPPPRPEPEPEPPPKRKRGRPRKEPREEPKEPRKRGRPRKEPQEHRTFTLSFNVGGLTIQYCVYSAGKGRLKHFNTKRITNYQLL